MIFLSWPLATSLPILLRGYMNLVVFVCPSSSYTILSLGKTLPYFLMKSADSIGIRSLNTLLVTHSSLLISRASDILAISFWIVLDTNN